MVDLSVLTKKFIEELGVKCSQEFVENQILSHPNGFSLLAIAETLDLYNIDNIAVNTDKSKLASLPLPCIVQDDSSNFFVLKEFSEERIVCISSKGKTRNFSLNNFIEQWNGICLLAEVTDDSSEPGLKQKQIIRRTKDTFAGLISLMLLYWILVSLVDSEVYMIEPYLISLTLLLKITGIVIGVSLLWYEIDKNNPTLQKFCSGKNNLSCDSVLGSEHANLFGSDVNLSLLVLSYFSGSFLFMIITGFSSLSLNVLSFLSFLTIPLILYSVYYQIKLKKWCRLCLAVTTVLILEISLSISYLSKPYLVDFKSVPLLLALISIPIFIWPSIKNVLVKAKEDRYSALSLKRIKRNPEFLNSLLSKSKKLSENTDGLGIRFRNPEARHKILKICHPYCDPCADAHPILKKLLDENKIDLQIIYSIGNIQTDIQTRLVKYFLAIDAHPDLDIREALDKWYNSKKRDFKTFVQHYDLNGEIKLQENRIEAMDVWCEKENLHRTPTIFINGFQLPQEYSIEDLELIL